MRNLKILIVGVLLTVPGLSMADASEIPGGASWYFYVDIDQMRSGGPGKPVYDWLRDEVLEEIDGDSGLNVEQELNRLFAGTAGTHLVQP